LKKVCVCVCVCVCVYAPQVGAAALVRRCAACLVTSTPQWRTFGGVRGPAGLVPGPVVLCNACGVRYVRSGQMRLADAAAVHAKRREEAAGGAPKNNKAGAASLPAGACVGFPMENLAWFRAERGGP